MSGLRCAKGSSPYKGAASNQGHHAAETQRLRAAGHELHAWTNQGGKSGGDGRGPWGGGGPPPASRPISRNCSSAVRTGEEGSHRASVKGRGGIVVLLIVAIVWLLSGTISRSQRAGRGDTRRQVCRHHGIGPALRLPWPIESVESSKSQARGRSTSATRRVRIRRRSRTWPRRATC